MNPFQVVRQNRPGRSVFDLSYEKKFTCDMGQLIPVLCEEMVPGDSFKIGNHMVIRFNPTVAPFLHEVNAFVHYFKVPLRILWDDWEDFISGGDDGEFADPLPRWEPTPFVVGPPYVPNGNGKGSLWDYLGLPIEVDPDGAYPVDFIRRAYNRIYNEYYRDQNLITEVAETNEAILNRAWEKDYFTSALPWQQRGITPALPISGVGSAVWDPAIFTNTAPPSGSLGFGTTAGAHNIATGSTNTNQRDNAVAFFNDNTVDLSEATTFDIADLRLAFQVQRWMEANARAGVRYTEFLRMHFGVAPRDDRLDRPEYIGGSRSPVIVSEVLQTSSTDATTPQGNLAGHALVADSNFVGTVFAEEFCLVVGILSVMPRTAYQQGIDRQYLRQTRFDYYFPEFANLSEQQIQRAEIYASNVAAQNQTPFGYQGRYDEMRIKRNMVCADMRDDFDYWHLGRKFSSAPALNQTFIECNPAETKRIFAVQSVPGLVVNFGNRIKAIRPLPVIAQPGLIDHV